MNWIILIIAGLFEVGFAACLGKAREMSGDHRVEDSVSLAGTNTSLTDTNKSERYDLSLTDIT